MKAIAKRIGVEISAGRLATARHRRARAARAGPDPARSGPVVLATQYEWAERRLEPGPGARDQDRERRRRDLARITISALGARASPPSVSTGASARRPTGWPLDDKWWLPGGWGTGSSLNHSRPDRAGCSVVYSYRESRGEKAEQP